MDLKTTKEMLQKLKISAVTFRKLRKKYGWKIYGFGKENFYNCEEVMKSFYTGRIDEKNK